MHTALLRHCIEQVPVQHIQPCNSHQWSPVVEIHCNSAVWNLTFDSVLCVSLTSHLGWMGRALMGEHRLADVASRTCCRQNLGHLCCLVLASSHYCLGTWFRKWRLEQLQRGKGYRSRECLLLWDDCKFFVSLQLLPYVFHLPHTVCHIRRHDSWLIHQGVPTVLCAEIFQVFKSFDHCQDIRLERETYHEHTAIASN